MVNGGDEINRYINFQSDLSSSHVTIDESFRHTGELRGPKKLRDLGIS